MGDSREERGDATGRPVVDWVELLFELDLPADPFAACSDRSGEPPPDLGEALRAYNPVVPVHHRTAGEVWRHWVGEWRRRIAQDWDVMIVIDGERGSGKSALAQEIGRRMDPGFSPKQVALSAREMLRLYGTLHRGQVAIYDESALGLLSRGFMSEEAIALVQAALIGRKLGIISVLAIPDLMLLDVAFRESILKYRITVESREEGQRGTAWIHFRRFAPRYSRSDRRGLYLDREWNPLRWNDPNGNPAWTEYSARADRTAREFALRKAEELERHERVRGPVPEGEIRGAIQVGRSDRWIERNFRVGRKRIARLRRKVSESEVGE